MDGLAVSTANAVLALYGIPEPPTMTSEFEVIGVLNRLANRQRASNLHPADTGEAVEVPWRS